MTALRVDLKRFQAHFDVVSTKVRSRIEALYMTECPQGHGEVPITHVIWADDYQCPGCGTVSTRADESAHVPIDKCRCGGSLQRGVQVGSRMLEIGHGCPVCIAAQGSNRRFLSKKPSVADKALLFDIQARPIPAWVPPDRFYYPAGRPFLKKEHSDRVVDLFEKRALIGLSLLYQAIEELPPDVERDLMKLCFTSNLHSVSKLNMVHGKRWKEGGLPSRGWVIHSFYVPPLRIEFPVWFYFNERFQTFLEGKEQTEREIPSVEAKNLSALFEGEGNFRLEQRNSVELDDVLPPNSVDYVFTDPPYGGAIQYLELSSLYNAWLRGPEQRGFNAYWQDEITINNGQEKSFDYYHVMLRAVFDNVFKVLKPDRYMTVTFHSTDIRVWNSILRAIHLAGFELEKIIYQPPPVKSIKAMMQPYGSAVGDYYIRFRKPKEGKIAGITRDDKLHEQVIVNGAKSIIANRGEPTPLTIILNGIVPYLRKENALLCGDKAMKMARS